MASPRLVKPDTPLDACLLLLLSRNYGPLCKVNSQTQWVGRVSGLRFHIENTEFNSPTTQTEVCLAVSLILWSARRVTCGTQPWIAESPLGFMAG